MSRSRLEAYRVTRGPVASSTVSGGVARVLHVPANVDGFARFGCRLRFVTLGEQEALAEGGYPGVPDPLRAHLPRRSH